MKRLYVLFIFTGFLSFTFAQSGTATLHKVSLNLWRPGSVKMPSTPYVRLKKNSASAVGRSLNYDTLGTAGNLFTILEGEVHSLAMNPTLNTLVFVHRANEDAFPADNIGQFMYDVSKDGGNTWSINNGVLDPTANNVTTAGRYPNGAIYNAAGNTTPDSAYVAYLGSWLPYNNGVETTTTTWRGFIAGVGELDNNPSTYTTNVTTFNDSDVIIAHSLCNGLPGEFWACDFSSPDGIVVNGLLVYKGVWNENIHDIVWSLNQKFVPNFNPLDTLGALTICMAFDPTGTYGWVASTADISTDTNFVYRPVMYHTVDGGATWSGPTDVVLDSMPGVLAKLPTPNGVTVRPDCLGSISMGVDYIGNPHLQFAVFPGNGADYYATGNYKMYDLTLNAAGQWSMLLLDSLLSFDGTFDIAAGDNRPQVSTTPDGKKVIFGWLDTNLGATGATGNTFPNLFSRAYDVTSGLADSNINETGNDPVWSDQALFATFPVFSFIQGNTIQVPTVFAELDQTSLLSTDPASFYYYHSTTHNVSNIIQDITPPVIYIKGCNPVIVGVNSTYVDSGATAIDNVDGNITGNIITTNANLSTTTAGTYYVQYQVTDAAGNTVYASRTVIVSASPPPLPVLTLIGADTITIDACATFNDPGVTAEEIVGNDTFNITNGVTNNLSALPLPTDSTKGTPGTYSLVYVASNCSGTDTVIRIVIVSTTAGGTNTPQFTFANGDTTYVYLGTKYLDTIPAVTDCPGIDTVYSDADSVVVNTNNPDTVIVTYTAVDSAGNIGTATRVVIINSEPTPNFIYSFIADKGYYFLDQSTNDPSKWTWNFDDGTGSTAQNPPAHKFIPYDTTYNVCLTVTNIFNTKFNKAAKTYCDSIYVYGAEGIEQLALDNSFSLYPNPTTGNVTLDVNSTGFKEMNVAVFNLLGENVKNLNVTGVPAQGKYNIDLSSFARGIYLVRIQTEVGTVTRKLTLFSGN